MKTIIKRLVHLEEARRTNLETTSSYDGRALLEANLNRIAARMRASGNWPPEPRVTVEEMKLRLDSPESFYRLYIR
jgi:hypothetical protein